MSKILKKSGNSVRNELIHFKDFILVTVMEQNYMQTGAHMNDLDAMIQLKTHESFKAKAELDILKGLIETTKNDCNTIAAKLEAFEDSGDTEEIEKHKDLSKVIIDKWCRYKYYQDRKVAVDEKIVKICNELTELLFQKMQMEVVHL